VIIRTITFLTLGANKSLGCSYKAMRKADGGALRIQHWWRVTRPFFDRNRVNKATFRSLVPFLRFLVRLFRSLVPVRAAAAVLRPRTHQQGEPTRARRCSVPSAARPPRWVGLVHAIRIRIRKAEGERMGSTGSSIDVDGWTGRLSQRGPAAYERGEPSQMGGMSPALCRPLRSS
jgi:hypothetical protein